MHMSRLEVGMTGGPDLGPADSPGDTTDNFTTTNVQLLLEEDPGVAGERMCLIFLIS